MIDGLKTEHRTAIIDALAADNRVERAVLFGSRATETYTPASDVDIALFGDRLTLIDQARLNGVIEALTIPQQVDLVLHAAIDNNVLRKHIESQGIEWYQRRESEGTELQGLLPKHRKVLKAILRQHLPDTEVWVYGNRMSSPENDGCDLNLVLRARDLQKISDTQLDDFRCAVCESSVPIPVNAQDWASLSEQFRREIERTHVVLVDGIVTSADWPHVEIGDISEIVGGSTPSTKDIRNFDGDIPWLTPKDLSGVHDRVVFRGKRNLSSIGFSSCSARLLPPKAILVSTRAPVGYVAIAGTEIATNQGFRSLILKKDICPEFIYYWLKHNTDELERHATGTTFRELSGSALKSIRIPLPPLPEQRAIAHVLGTLDGKIELFRRMNETLEAIARAIFRDWFFDFSPVRAKLAGRDTGLPKDIANCFPMNIVDSEIGEIPEGWRIGYLDNIATFSRKNIDPVDLDNDIPYIGLEHMPRRSLALSDWENVEKVTSNKMVFEKGSILFGKLRPYFHKVGVAPINGVCSTDIVVVVPKAVEWSAFVTMCISSDEFVDYVNRTSTGTKMPRTSWRTMSNYLTIFPEISVVRVFQSVVEPLLDRIVVNIHEARSLSTLRDTLLPKLVSGELRLCDVILDD